MTRAQWVILWWLQRQPALSQKELAEIMDVEPITVARLVDRLAQRGMVERRDDPSDRRIWRLHLLPPAIPVLADMRGEREQVQAILAAGLPPETLQLVGAALLHMKANIVGEMRARDAERRLAASYDIRLASSVGKLARRAGRKSVADTAPSPQQDHA